MINGVILDRDTFSKCISSKLKPSELWVSWIRVKWLPTDVYSCVLSTVLSIWDYTDVVVFLQNRHNFEKPVKIYN